MDGETFYREDIELALDGYLDIYHARDPAPFEHRDLEEHIVTYIEQSYHELADNEDVTLKIYLPGVEQDEGMEKALTESIHNYFEFTERDARKELRHHYLKSAGLAVMGAGFIAGSAFVPILAGVGIGASIAAEIIGIGGWVGEWNAISNILFDSGDKRETVDMYDRLSEAKVEFVYD